MEHSPHRMWLPPEEQPWSEQQPTQYISPIPEYDAPPAAPASNGHIPGQDPYPTTPFPTTPTAPAPVPYEQPAAYAVQEVAASPAAALPSDPGRAPDLVRVAFWLVLAQFAFPIAGLTVALVLRGRFIEALGSRFNVNFYASPVVADFLDRFLLLIIVLAIVLLLAMDGLMLLFALMMLSGRGWARVLLTIWASCNGAAALIYLTGLTTSYSLALIVNLFIALNLAGAVVGAVPIVLMFRETASSWFAAKALHRKAKRRFPFAYAT